MWLPPPPLQITIAILHFSRNVASGYLSIVCALQCILLLFRWRLAAEAPSGGCRNKERICRCMPWSCQGLGAASHPPHPFMLRLCALAVLWCAGCNTSPAFSPPRALPSSKRVRRPLPVAAPRLA